MLERSSRGTSRPQERSRGARQPNLAGDEEGSPRCRTPPGNGTALSERLMRIAGHGALAAAAPLRGSSAESFPERRQRGASGARHLTAKDGHSASLREMSKHFGCAASHPTGDREGKLPPHPDQQTPLPCSPCRPKVLGASRGAGPARPWLRRVSALLGGAAPRARGFLSGRRQRHSDGGRGGGLWGPLSARHRPNPLCWRQGECGVVRWREHQSHQVRRLRVLRRTLG